MDLERFMRGPDQSFSLLEELDIMPFPDNGPCGQEAYFTGWKYADLADNSIVGQIIQRIPCPPERNGDWAAYVNLPGMEVGIVSEGGRMNIGTERLPEKMGIPQMRGLLIAGMEKLREYIASEVWK